MVVLDLVSPGFRVGLGPEVSAAVVAVPKATVDENRDFGLRPRKVRVAWQRPTSTPPGKSRRT